MITFAECSVNEADARKSVAEWIDAWNRRDLDAIVMHYTEDVEFSSPTVAKRWGAQSGGRILGRSHLREHFRLGLEAYPEMHFELVDVLFGVCALTVLYRRENGTLVADVIELTDDGRTKVARAFYAAAPAR